MRNPERIDVAMKALTEIWKRNPDVRFHQLVESLKTQYVEDNEAHYHVIKSYKTEYYNGKPVENTVFTIDMFYLEDDEWINFLINFAEKGR